jgi:dienelactone hydrolase
MTRMLRFAIVAACGWATIFSSLAGAHQRKGELIPRRVLFAEADRAAVAVAGNGSRAAFVDVRDGRRRLSLATLDAPHAGQEVQLPDDATPLSCQWSLDEGLLLVPCQRGDATRVFIHDPAAGRTSELAKDVTGSLEIARLSGARPGEALLAQRGAKGGLKYWQVALADGAAEPAIEAASLDRVLFDSDFAPRAATRAGAAGATEILRRDGQAWQPAYTMGEDLTNPRRLPRAGVTGVVGWNDASDELLLVDNNDADRSRLVARNLESGQTRVLAEDPDADLTVTPIVDRRTGQVLAASGYFGELRRNLLEPSLAGDFEFLKSHFGSTVGFAQIARGDAVWTVATLDGGPPRFFAYRSADRRLWPLGSTHSALDDYVLARRTAHVVTARDGLKLPCQLYVARRLDADGDGLPDAPCPTLLYVHGGPTIAAPWDNWFANRCLQLLADRGYAVLNVEFRGAGGYGKQFAQKIWGNWGRATVPDFEDIARWAVERRIALKEKIGIWGWSYGGLATFSSLAFSPDTFACGIAMYGLSDMETFARFVSFGPQREQIFERIGNPTTPEGKAALREQSPLFAVERIKRPLLMAQGGQDRVVPRAHSDRLVEALSKHRDDVTYLLYPKEVHDFRESRSWISFWAVAERFLHEHLGGDYEPAGTDLDDPTFEVLAGADQIPGLPAAK